MVNKKPDIIIILGQKLTNGGLLTFKCRERCYLGWEMYNENKGSILLLSGGKTNSKIKKSEASGMREYLIELGVVENDMILEEKSENTYQNAKYCFEILEKMDIGQKTIVSSSDHIYRWIANPIRFFNVNYHMEADCKACLDSGIECLSYEKEKNSDFVIVSSKKAFEIFVSKNKDKNIFFRFKGMPYRDGFSSKKYSNKDKEMFASHIKKLYKLEDIEVIEI
ncbi:MAG: YdcF family protein [Clostridia bacterium]